MKGTLLVTVLSAFVLVAGKLSNKPLLYYFDTVYLYSACLCLTISIQHKQHNDIKYDIQSSFVRIYLN